MSSGRKSPVLLGAALAVGLALALCASCVDGHHMGLSEEPNVVTVSRRSLAQEAIDKKPAKEGEAHADEHAHGKVEDSHAEHGHEEHGHEEHGHEEHGHEEFAAGVGHIVTAGDAHQFEEHFHGDGAEHIIEEFGANGVLTTETLEGIFSDISGGSCERDAHGHHDGHGDHGDEHGHNEAPYVISPKDILDEFGHNGGLNKSGLDMACPEILRCQIEPACELEFHYEEHHGKSKTPGSDVSILKIVAAAVLFVEAIIGALVPLAVGQFKEFKLWLSLLNNFSAGVFITSGFAHLIPHALESQHEVEGLGEYPLAAVLVVVGFMLILFIEHVVFGVHSHCDPSDCQVMASPTHKDGPQARAISGSSDKLAIPTPAQFQKQSATVKRCLILLLAISVHAIIEAMALGLSDTRRSVLLLFAGVGSHKGVASMALSARFMKDEASRGQLLLCLFLFSLISPIGIFIGLAVTQLNLPILVTLVLNALSAGTFIYVGTLEVIAEEFLVRRLVHKKMSDRMLRALQFSAVILGTLILSLIEMVPEGHDHH